MKTQSGYRKIRPVNLSAHEEGRKALLEGSGIYGLRRREMRLIKVRFHHARALIRLAVIHGSVEQLSAALKVEVPTVEYSMQLRRLPDAQTIQKLARSAEAQGRRDLAIALCVPLAAALGIPAERAIWMTAYAFASKEARIRLRKFEIKVNAEIPGFLYAIRRSPDGAIKLGFSNDVSVRRLALKQGPEGEKALTVLGTVPVENMRGAEKRAHAAFHKERLAANREWFRLSNDQVCWFLAGNFEKSPVVAPAGLLAYRVEAA